MAQSKRESKYGGRSMSNAVPIDDMATGKPVADLFCPNDMVGPIDVFLIPHHGGVDVAGRSTFGATPPTVAIVNNGRTKGGAAATFSTLPLSRFHGRVATTFVGQ